jgi:TonB family protein
MSGVPASIPPSSAEPLSTGVPRLRGPIQLGLLTTDLDSESVFATLQLAIARSSAERDVILGAIVEAAQALTDASGAALAVQCDGAIICRARSGETAPDLGARLSLDSGISGECLRTGQILRCDDTEKDFRVDPEVCRRLGLRSIAIVPLRGRYGPTGILEVFSTRSYAFSDEHMSYLVRLAGLAEAAQERGARAERPAAKAVEAKTVGAQPVEVNPGKKRAEGTWFKHTANSAVLVRVKDVFAGYARPLFAGERERYWAAANILVLLLILFLSWRAWHTPSSQAAPAARPAQSVTVPGMSSPESAAAPVGKPSPIRTGTRATGTETSGAERHAVKIEITDLTTATANPDVSAEASGGVEQSPQIPTPGTNTVAIGNQLASSVSVPQLGVPASQGMSEAVLQYEVQPVYPQGALLRGMKGRVVLQATIAEDGKVEGVIVMSGNAVLARAAADAIQQWQYRPALLNGKPVRTQKQIAVTFAAR